MYAYNLVLIFLGPERKGRAMTVEQNDETVGVVGKAIAEDVIGHEDTRVETIEEKQTTAHTDSV